MASSSYSSRANVVVYLQFSNQNQNQNIWKISACVQTCKRC